MEESVEDRIVAGVSLLSAFQVFLAISAFFGLRGCSVLDELRPISAVGPRF